MGFQTGSQIRPELGALDYSGYTNAAAIQGQAMANLGQQVGGAIEGYYKKKEKKKEDEIRLNAVKSFLPNIGIDEKNPDFDQISTSLAKNPDVFEAYMQFDQAQKEQERVSLKMLQDQEFNKLKMEGQRLDNIGKTLENSGVMADKNDLLALNKAIAMSTEATEDGTGGGKVNLEMLDGLFTDLGGVNQEVVKKYKESVAPDLTVEQRNVAAEAKARGITEAQVYEERRNKGPLVQNIIGGEDKEGLTIPQQEKESIYQSNINNILSSRPRAIEMSQLADEGMSMLAMGTKTGLGQDAIMKAKQIGNMLGLDYDISNQEQFKSRFEPLMMEKIAETKGAISDREMNLFKSWVGSLDKTPEGNMKFFKSLKKASENQKATSEIANRMIDEGASASQINAKIDEYLINNPVAIYSSKDKKDASGETEIVNSLPREKADRLIYLRNKLNK